MFNESRPAARDGKPLIIVTDPDNGCDEDLLLTAYLRRAGFAVEVIGPEDFLDRSSQIQGVPVLARDLWPECNADHGLFERCKDTMLALARESGIQLWNSADGRGDQLGKEYLVALYADERFRDLVIPSAYLGEGSKNLPSSDRYIIKPIRGLSSLGIRMTTGEGLRELEALDGGVHREFIVQPEIRFEAERSFYFIDGEFQYCLDFRPSKIPDWPTPELVEPSEETLSAAKRLVAWNNMSRGVQRIDMVLVPDGGVRLLEIEDFTPYLSLTELPTAVRKRVLERLVDSVREHCVSRGSASHPLKGSSCSTAL